MTTPEDPQRRFTVGSRVRVLPNSPWAKGADGVINTPHELAARVTRGRWEDGLHIVHRGDRVVRYWWVVFDELQFDEEDGGPWPSGEIEDEYLEDRSESSSQR
jgi:hypothetical protein